MKRKPAAPENRNVKDANLATSIIIWPSADLVPVINNAVNGLFGGDVPLHLSHVSHSRITPNNLINYWFSTVGLRLHLLWLRCTSLTGEESDNTIQAEGNNNLWVSVHSLLWTLRNGLRFLGLTWENRQFCCDYKYNSSMNDRRKLTSFVRWHQIITPTLRWSRYSFPPESRVMMDFFSKVSSYGGAGRQPSIGRQGKLLRQVTVLTRASHCHTHACGAFTPPVPQLPSLLQCLPSHSRVLTLDPSRVDEEQDTRLG